MKQIFRKKGLVITILLGILLCVAFYDVVFLNKTFKVTTANSQALPNGVYGQENNKPAFIPVNGTDAPVLEEPIYEFIKKNLWHGILPLWNPHQACGYALIGMIQTAIFYPLNIILYTLPSMYSWDILILLRLLLAGLFTFWFMKTLKFDDMPSLAAAIAFMLSGPLVLLQYWTTNVDLLLPLLLLCFEKVINGPNKKTIAFLGMTVGLTILGGHPEHIFLVNAYGAAFFIFRTLSTKGIKSSLKILPAVAASYLLGVGISAIALFPFIQNFLTEFWQGHPAGAGLLMEEQRERIITLALPHFFQKAPVTFDWTFAGWWGGYLGIFPIGLAILGLFHHHERKLRIFLGTMAFIIIAKEYGMPVINWLGYLPFFSMIRYAIHTPPLAAFSVAVLAGMGVHAITARKSMLRHGIIFAAILSVIILINLFIVRDAPHFGLSFKASAFAGLILLVFIVILILKKMNIVPAKIIAALLVSAIFLELFSYIHRERPHRFDSFPDVPYLSMLKSATTPIRSYGNFWAFYPNTATAYGVDDIGFFMGLAPKRFVHFVNEILSPGLFKNNFRSPALRCIPVVGREPFLDLLNVHYIILPSNPRFSRPFLHRFGDYTAKLNQVYNGEVKVFQRPDTFPRAFMVYETYTESDPEKTLELVKKLRGRLRHIAVIRSGDKNGRIQTLLKPNIDYSRIHFEKYTPNLVEITVDTKYQGFMVFSDAYHPDWKAYIDGKKTKIYQTDYLIRSVFVPKGTHRVVFRFQPFWFYAGAIVSLIALVVLVTLVVLPIRKSTK